MRLACSPQPGLLLGRESTADWLKQEQRAQHRGAVAAAAAATGSGCSPDQHLRVCRLCPLQLAPSSGLLGATWAQKLHRTWRFIEAVMRGQVPTMLPGQRGAVAAGVQVSLHLQLERWRRHQGARQQSPNCCQLSYRDMQEMPHMDVVWAAGGSQACGSTSITFRQAGVGRAGRPVLCLLHMGLALPRCL